METRRPSQRRFYFLIHLCIHICPVLSQRRWGAVVKFESYDRRRPSRGCLRQNATRTMAAFVSAAGARLSKSYWWRLSPSFLYCNSERAQGAWWPHLNDRTDKWSLVWDHDKAAEIKMKDVKSSFCHSSYEFTCFAIPGFTKEEPVVLPLNLNRPL